MSKRKNSISISNSYPSGSPCLSPSSSSSCNSLSRSNSLETGFNIEEKEEITSESSDLSKVNASNDIYNPTNIDLDSINIDNLDQDEKIIIEAVNRQLNLRYGDHAKYYEDD